MDAAPTLIRWAAGSTAAGLVAGVAYRELTRSFDVVPHTQLSVVHTHLLTLGTVMFLLFAVIERVFHFSGHRLYRPFLFTYCGGFIVTTAMQFTIGTLQLYGKSHSAALSGISGLGHILLTLGFAFFFIALLNAISEKDARPVARDSRAS
ncbi:MAG: DUF2871 domain-containing protein [Bowdeniella nasicola]|nr:DUF2871 domain-containing protein [Bowdeniella nasicola]